MVFNLFTKETQVLYKLSLMYVMNVMSKLTY